MTDRELNKYQLTIRMSQKPEKPRRKHDRTFKQEAVNHWVTSGKPAAEVAHELGLHVNLLYAWKHRLCPSAPEGAEGQKPTTLADAQVQLEAAQREIRRLREQRDILKKTLGIISETPSSGTSGSTR